MGDTNPTTTPGEPIAVVGSSCRFAGGVTSPRGLWEVLVAPADLARPVPAARFHVDAFSHRDPEHHGTTDAPRGYFLAGDHRVFDAHLFHITPKEAEAMDPQQRHALEVLYEAVEAAGYPLDRLAGEPVAVYTGVMTRDYDTLTARDDLNASQYAATGNARSILANRLSYFFDLRGPSMTIDTACSASLVALHQAVQALRAAEVPLACVVGVNLILTPEQSIAESKLHMLSPSAHCQMWDARADGYARGEGVSAIVLKPLRRALADGDRIQAVIRETGVNSDGRTKGITMPSAMAQSALIRQTYQKCGLDPDNADHRPQFFEAHGTGTPVGDPVEARAIADAFFPAEQEATLNTEEGKKLLVGSIKTVIGHTEGAAGLAGLLKVIQAMNHGCVPPNMHLHEVNPAVAPFLQHLQVPTKAVQWPAPPAGQPRRASVNSFGFGGTNAHVIVEKYDPEVHNPLFSCTPAPAFQELEAEAVGCTSSISPLISPEHESKSALPLVFSAATQKSLAATLQQWRQFLADNPTMSYEALAWHLYHHRTTHPFRAAIVADAVPSAVEALDKLIASGKQDNDNQNKIGHRSSGKQQQHSATSTTATTAPPKVLGVFTGQGAQYVHMSKGLFLSNPVYRATIQALDQFLQSCPDPPADAQFLQNELLADEAASRLGTAHVSQVLCTALQLALVDLLASLDVRFHAVVGHSSGDIAAAYAALRLSRRDAILLAYYRGKYTHLAGGLKNNSDPDSPVIRGGMLACGLTAPQASALCARPEYQDKLFVAARNSPTLTTLSGDRDAVQQAVTELQAQGTFARPLRVDVAYHSPHMRAPVVAYSTALAACDIQPHGQQPGGPLWFSSVYGSHHQEDMSSDLANQYWCDNMLRPVLFQDAVEAAVRMCGPFDCAIEVGPHPALKAPFQETTKAGAGAGAVTAIPYLSPLDRTQDDRLALAAFFGAMWTRFGPHAVNLPRHVQDTQPELLLAARGLHADDLPTYAWDHSHVHWRESRLSEQFHFRTAAPHELLGVRTSDDTPARLRWRNILKFDKLPWAEGHKFQGQALLPASAYCVMALDAAQVLLGGRAATVVELEGLEFLSGIALEADSLGVETLFTLSVLSEENASSTTMIEAEFDLESVPLTSFAIPPMKKTFCGRGRITLDANARLPRRQPSLARAETLPVDVTAFYHMMEGVGLEYTGPFRALKSLDRRMNYAKGTLDLRHPAETTGLVVSPAMLDSCFHATFATFSSPGDNALWTTFLPTKIARLCFNVATSNPFQDHDEVLVETYLTSFQPPTAASAAATLTSNLEVWYSEAGQLAIQVEGLTVSSFAEAKPANDHELYLHTVFELDPEDEIVTVLSARYGDLDPYSVKGQTSATLPDPAPSHVTDQKKQKNKSKEDKNPYNDKESESDEEPTPFYTNRKPPSGRNNKIVRAPRPLAERHAEQLPGFRTFVGRLAQQLAHKYPRMRVLDLTDPAQGLTEGVLARLDGAFSSYHIGHTGFAAAAAPHASHKVQNKVVDASRREQHDHEEDPYDLVLVSSSALPGTATPVAALQNIRALTRDGGFLIFIDMVSPAKLAGSTASAPAIKWPALLEHQCDFAATARNCEQDYPAVATLCVRQAGGRQLATQLAPNIPVLAHLLIVGGGPSPSDTPASGLAQSLRARLQRFCGHVTTVPTLEQVDPQVARACTAVLLLADADDESDPVCGATSMNAQRLQTLQALVRPGVVLLWVTSNARDDPDRAAALGLTRSLKAEVPHLTLQVLDLGRMGGSVDLIFDVFNRLCACHEVHNVVVEPEIHVGLGSSLFVPRVVPYRPANDRLNAYRRVVTTTVDTRETPVQLLVQPRNSQSYHFGLLERTQHRPGPPVLVHVEYSAAQRVTVPADGGSSSRSYYVYAGRMADSGRAVVGLSDVSASVVLVSPNDDVPFLRVVEDFEEADSQSTTALLHLAATALWHTLTAMDIVNHRTGGYNKTDCVVLVAPTQAMLDSVRHVLLQQEQQRNPRTRRRCHLRILSPDRHFVEANPTGAVHVHPWSTAREVGIALSSLADPGSSCAVVNFLDPNHRLSATLASMQQQQQGGAFQYYCHDHNNNSVDDSSFLSQQNNNTNKNKFEALLLGGGGGTTIATEEFWKIACDHAINLVQGQLDGPGSTVWTLSLTTPAQILGNNSPIASGSTMIINWTADLLLALPVAPLANPGCLRPDRTYLLVGLTRDLGQSLCRLFLAQGARHLVVTSRNPPPQPPAWVAELNHTHGGAVVVVERLDVAVLADVHALATRLANTMPPVAGLVNAAMVLDDRVFSHMDLATWDRVMAPKALGSKNLDLVFSPPAPPPEVPSESTPLPPHYDPNADPYTSTTYRNDYPALLTNRNQPDDHLDFFIMTSSFAAVGGHAGQANYAAANMAMQGLAARRRARGLAATALHVGVLHGVGLLAREDRRATYQGLARDGYPPIAERDLHHMFMEAIEGGRNRPGQQGGDGVAGTDLVTGLARYRVDDPEPMHWHLDRRFCHFTVPDATPTHEEDVDNAAHNKQTLKQAIEAAGSNTEDVARVLLDAMCRRIEAILQHPAGSINNDTAGASFADLGVDSLAAVELRNWVYKAIGQDVPVMKILGAPSIARLCDDVAEKIVQGS